MTIPTDESTELVLIPLWRRWRWRVAGLLALILLVAAFLIFRSNIEVARQMATIRARGEPVTLEELEAYYPRPPADRDSTQLWLDAAQAVSQAAKVPLGSRLRFFGQFVPPQDADEARLLNALLAEFIENHAAEMQQLHAAADFGGEARYPIEFAYPGKGNLTSFQESAELLSAEASLRAENGDLHGAVASIRTMWLLAQSLENEPTLGAQWTRFMIQRSAYDWLNDNRPRKLPTEDLEQLQAMLGQNDFGKSIKRALVGQRVFGLWVYSDPDVAGVGRPMRYFSSLSRNHDQALYLRHMAELIEAAELPTRERIETTGKLLAEQAENLGRFDYIARTLSFELRFLGEELTSAETENRQMTIRVAMARYQQQNRWLPRTLEDLAPKFLSEIPRDPASGEPFIYRTLGEDYTIKSPSLRSILQSH